MAFFINYIYLVVSILLVFFLGLLIFGFFFFLIEKEQDIEKLSIYECGFEPFEETRLIFDVKFYLVAILFIVFDLEIIFLFPQVLVLPILNIVGFLSMTLFFFFLSLVYIYEQILGALDQ